MFRRAQRLFVRLINVGAQTTNIERRHQVRAFNTLLVVFIPVSPLIVLIPLIFASITQRAYVDQANIISVVVTEIILILCYVLNRGGWFSISRWVLIIFMTITIVLNSNASSPPHLEIIYLLTLPAIGLFLLSRREMLWLSALVLVVMFIFAGAHSESLQDSVTDLISVVAINAFLLLLISIYRDRLEASRSRVLVEKETQLRLMLDNLPAIVWRLDKDLQPLSSAGGPRDAEMREQIIASLTGEDAYRAALQVVLAGVSVNFEHESNGVFCRSYAEAMLDANGAIIGCSGITVDISSQKQEEERLRAAAIERERMRVLENFLESASHDLRTPLTEMNMSIELLNRTPDPERRAYHGQRLTQGIQRLDHILDMMFTMVRLDLAKPEQNLPLDLNHLVEIVVEEEEESATKQEVRLSSDLAADLENIASYDNTALQMALEQVLRNALQNTPAGGSISLRTLRQDARICLEVADTGVGIPAKELGYVFDRFYRVEKHRPLDDLHTGLGLAIAKRVVELHNGDITIESEVGRGTRVMLCFPAVPATPAA